MDKPIADCCCDKNGRNGRPYDLAVIGAGSAGFSATIAAADQGAQVALIGAGTIGGTCVNIGCVPSKTLIRATEAIHNARVAARFAGIAAEARVTEWRETVQQKDALVTELRQSKYVDLLRSYNGIAYREGPAVLWSAVWRSATIELAPARSSSRLAHAPRSQRSQVSSPSLT